MAEERQKMIETLARACAVAQSKGAFSLKDASIVYSAVASLTTEKKEMKEEEAISALIQASAIGQKAGAYSLEDANTVYKVVKFFDEKKPLETITEE